MKLQQLRYFVAVYEEGSFSAGAVRAKATQSGLSMQVRELEDRYGVRLFDRSTAGVSPTDAGTRFYRHASQVLRKVSEAEDELKRIKGEVAGDVRVGLMPTFTRSVLPDTLLRLNAEHPLISSTVCEAYSAQLSEMTAQGQLDFAVVPAFDEQPSLTASHLAIDREYLVCSPRVGLPNRKPVRLRDLWPLRLVLPGRANARRRRIEGYIADNGVEVAEIMELDAMLATLELVTRSDWVAILPGILCSADAAGTVRTIHPIDDPILAVTYIRIEPASRGLGDAAQVFNQVLCEELEAALQWDDTLSDIRKTNTKHQ